ncbi:MAG: NAD(P)-binding protein, partial [Erysipelotrichaceae bacterium]|nr:NAD(P)-binding protein [Erysipelotrichaceae bacterium]
MDHNIRIAIIGGGPAGLSAGMYLEQKGYENYSILERSDHVGGKCSSPHYGERRYEMGAIMGAPTYYAVHDVEEFCGITHDG